MLFFLSCFNGTLVVFVKLEIDGVMKMMNHHLDLKQIIASMEKRINRAGWYTSYLNHGILRSFCSFTLNSQVLLAAAICTKTGKGLTIFVVYFSF